MITVRLNRPEFEYDIHSLIKAFYPAEEVSVSAGEPEGKRGASHGAKSPNEPLLYHMDVTYGEADISFEYYKCEAAAGADGADGTDAASRPGWVGGYGRKRLHQKTGIIRADTGGLFRPQGDKEPAETGIIPAAFRIYRSKITLGESDRDPSDQDTDESLGRGMGRMEKIARYMKETYYASDEKIDLSIRIAKRELELLHKLDYENGYSLYIGIPFCPSTCLYCSFTSYPLGVWKGRMDEYLSALEKEIDFTAVKFAHKKLNTIYIGGGTPTTLTAAQLDRLLRKIKCSFDLSHLVEFTVEAGRPDSITRDKLKALRNHDISRISINPQTMKQATLDLIGRHHTVEQTVESFYLARELGFDNINMDLIVGLPDESLDDVRNTMECLRELDPDSITVHSLAVKRAARLRMFKEDYQEHKIVNTKEHIDLTARIAGEMGLSPYYLYRQKNMAGNFENVGYARPGKAGVYNVLIMEEKQTIMALGAGATTKFVFENATRMERVENVKDIKNYLERTDEMIERKVKKMEEIAWH